MTVRIGVPASAILAILAAMTSLSMPAAARDANDKAIAAMAGEWELLYTNGSTRHYAIDKQGEVTFASTQETRKGRIFRKSEALLLMFGGEPKVERLTMGTDGRLFIEHYQQQADLVGKKLEIMGVGVRKK